MIEIKLYTNEKLLLNDSEAACILNEYDFVNGKALYLATYSDIIINEIDGIRTQYYKYIAKELRLFFDEFYKYDARRVFYSKHKNIKGFVRKTKINKLLNKTF